MTVLIGIVLYLIALLLVIVLAGGILVLTGVSLTNLRPAGK